MLNGPGYHHQTGKNEMKTKKVRRVSLSAPSSLLHPPLPQIPSRIHITCHTAAVIPKVEGLGHMQFDLDLLCSAWLRRRRRRVCVGCIPPRVFSICAAALALLRASGNDIGGNVVDFGVPLATSPATPLRSARPSGDGGERYCCCLLVSGSGIARHDGDLLLVPPSYLSL